MLNRVFGLVFLAVIGVSATAGVLADNAPTTVPAAWPAITSTNKPWTYWWWMGSAVNPADITRELERFHAAGIGGVHIIPIYGAKGYEAQFIDYLSPKWMDMLRHTVSEAKRLDMGVDMSTGTGWCFGGPTVTDQDAAASVASEVFEVKAGEAFRHNFKEALQALVAYRAGESNVDLLGKLTASSIDWTAPAGNAGWKVYAIWQKVSPRSRVKRPAPGGGGHMLNPFSTAAITNYLQWFDKPFADYKAQNSPMPRSMYHDSYEYQVNWSPDLLAEFEKRRGYRLQDHLPDFLSEAESDTTARLKCDYRETVSDMMVDGLARHWVDWSHAHGFITRYQAHGSPANLLDLYGAADIPETEMFHNDADPLVAKFASSAAHVMGHPLTSSETGTWMDEHFNETLAQYKRIVDLMFVSGVNHVFYHGACYSPEDAGWPGWHFYAATEMNSRNAFWHDVPAFNAYVARCQSILQSGKPDNDVLLYWPIHDLWSKSKGMTMNLVVHHREWFYEEAVGKAATALWKGGVSFDYLSDRQLASLTVVDGKAVGALSGKHLTIVVPEMKCIHPESLNKLFNLAAAGATIVFEHSLPSDVPGLADLESRRTNLKKVLDRFEATGHDKDGIAILKPAGQGQGVIVVGKDLVETVAASCGGGSGFDLTKHGLQFISRRDGENVNWFVRNVSDKPVESWIHIMRCPQMIFMDPLSGRVGNAAREGDQSDRVYFQLQPGESIILRCEKLLTPHLADWKYALATGNTIDLRGNWKIKFFDGGPELPKPFESAKLESWTKNGDPETERFAGTASYTITFDAPAGSKAPYRLDLGKVCESARVKLNGQDLGTVFAPPFAVTVDALKPTGNELVVEVTNLSANRIRDLDKRGVKWKTFYDANVVNIDYKPFDASGWPVRDSGLLGPVTLTPVSTEVPKSDK